MFERPELNSDCILVHVSVSGVESERQEFEELVRSTGANALGAVSARINTPHPRHLVGGGKTEVRKRRSPAKRKKAAARGRGNR